MRHRSIAFTRGRGRLCFSSPVHPARYQAMPLLQTPLTEPPSRGHIYELHPASHPGLVEPGRNLLPSLPAERVVEPILRVRGHGGEALAEALTEDGVRRGRRERTALGQTFVPLDYPLVDRGLVDPLTCDHVDTLRYGGGVVTPALGRRPQIQPCRTRGPRRPSC